MKKDIKQGKPSLGLSFYGTPHTHTHTHTHRVLHKLPPPHAKGQKQHL